MIPRLNIPNKIIRTPAIFVKAIFFRFKNTPIEVVVSPKSIKTKQKDIVKSRVLINNSLDNPSLVLMLLKSKVDRYMGNRGKMQGEKNDITPAKNAKKNSLKKLIFH